MITQNTYFIAGVALFLAIQAGMAGYFYLRSRRSAQASWEDLLGQLSAIDRDGISQVALDLIDETGQPREDASGQMIEPAKLWNLVGGLEGLKALEHNCEILIALAFYVQQWYPEAVTVAEKLRQDARELKWHVARLNGAAQTGNLQVSFPFYAQRAVATYYLMTRRLLGLYEAGNFAMLSALQRAL